MLETFVEFTFEAAHEVPPHASLHGHSFVVAIYLRGEQDPVLGWTHNLADVDVGLAEIKAQLRNAYLNEIEGLEVPTMANVAAWIWHRLNQTIAGLDRVEVRRGVTGAAVGCRYTGHATLEGA